MIKKKNSKKLILRSYYTLKKEVNEVFAYNFKS